MEVIVIAQMDNTIDHTFESANRIYSVNGIAPTIPTCGGGGIQPKILEIKKIGIICSFNISGSQDFGLSAVKEGVSNTLLTGDKIAILERICRKE